VGDQYVVFSCRRNAVDEDVETGRHNRCWRCVGMAGVDIAQSCGWLFACFAHNNPLFVHQFHVMVVLFSYFIIAKTGEMRNRQNTTLNQAVNSADGWCEARLVLAGVGLWGQHSLLYGGFS